MSGHELAKKLLEMPDLPVIGAGTGQGSGEGAHEPLVLVTLGDDPTLKHQSWGTGPGTISLHFCNPV